MDDILVTSWNDEEHLQYLTVVFESISYHGFQIKLVRYDFFLESVEYLEHIMSREGIHAFERKVKAITPQAIPYHFLDT